MKSIEPTVRDTLRVLGKKREDIFVVKTLTSRENNCQVLVLLQKELEPNT